MTATNTPTAPETPCQQRPHPTPSRTRWVLGVLLAAPFMAQVDATIANVALPSIHARLGASGAALELVIDGYLITFAVLLITGSRLGQTHGYRRIYLLGIALFGAASLLCGLAPSPVVLVAGRIMQGGGAALMYPQTLTGIQRMFTGPARTRAIGLYAAALSIGAVVGQIAGGALISADIAGTGWRPIFLVNVPIGILISAVGLRVLPPDTGRTARQLDVAGVAALSAALALLVMPLALGRSQGWPAWTWLCLAASVPAIAGFLRLQQRIAGRGGSPLIAISVLGRPPVRATLLALTVAVGTYYALLFLLAQYLQQGLHDTPLVSGLALVPWIATFGLAGQGIRRLPGAAARFAAPAGCLLLAAAYTAISLTLLTGHTQLAIMLVLLATGGLGNGILFSALMTRLTTLVPADYAPDVSGVSSTLIQIGGAIGIAAFGTFYYSLDHQAGAAAATHAFAVAAAALAAVALLAGGCAYRAARLA